MSGESAASSYEAELAAACDFMRERDDFLVVSHIQPDGDAVSSTLAVGWMLERLGKRYTMMNEGKIPAKFYGLWKAQGIVDFSAGPPPRTFDSVISVDCADFSRIGNVSGLFAADASLLNIDHHPTNDRFGAVHVVKDDAAATVEILFDLAMKLDLAWSKELAECMYTGLLTDTGGFRYSNTSPKVLQIASEMLAYGVNGNLLADRFLEKMTMAQIELLRRALATLTFAHDYKIAWVHVRQSDIAELGASGEDLDGIVNYPRNIDGVEVGLLFKEVADQTFKVSLRSAGKADVAQIAKTFGGGGHVRAAGCTLNGTLEQVEQIVVAKVVQAL